MFETCGCFADTQGMFPTCPRERGKTRHDTSPHSPPHLLPLPTTTTAPPACNVMVSLCSGAEAQHKDAQMKSSALQWLVQRPRPDNLTRCNRGQHQQEHIDFCTTKERRVEHTETVADAIHHHCWTKSSCPIIRQCATNASCSGSCFPQNHKHISGWKENLMNGACKLFDAAFGYKRPPRHARTIVF